MMRLAQAACEVGQSCVTVPSLEWFPQEYAYEFYVLKGVLALIGTLMLIYHMHKTWTWVTNWPQRLRYLVLFGFATLLTGASWEQINQGAPVNWRNIGAMLLAVALIVAMAISIHYDLVRERHRRTARHSAFTP